jgi:hypothetical protein
MLLQQPTRIFTSVRKKCPFFLEIFSQYHTGIPRVCIFIPFIRVYSFLSRLLFILYNCSDPAGNFKAVWCLDRGACENWYKWRVHSVEELSQRTGHCVICMTDVVRPARQQRLSLFISWSSGLSVYGICHKIASNSGNVVMLFIDDSGKITECCNPHHQGNVKEIRCK